MCSSDTSLWTSGICTVLIASMKLSVDELKKENESIREQNVTIQKRRELDGVYLLNELSDDISVGVP